MANDLTLPFSGTGADSRALFSITNTSTDSEASQDTNFAIGVIGRRPGGFGYLAGKDPLFEGLVGVYGESDQNGIFGRTASSVPADHAIYGQNDGAGHGVTGVSTTTGSTGFLAGRDPLFNGAVGVYGESTQNGVFGRTASVVPEDHAVYGQNDGAGRGVGGFSKTGIGVLGESGSDVGIVGRGGRLAVRFEGNRAVTGTLHAGNVEVTVDVLSVNSGPDFA